MTVMVMTTVLTVLATMILMAAAVKIILKQSTLPKACCVLSVLFSQSLIIAFHKCVSL